jgi:signal transduction histidine kinase
VQQPPELPLVVVDPDRLERVLTNLLSNALKYSDPATTVVLSACCVDSDVVMSVADRGAGINPDDLPHIFERYYRSGATGARDGLGLGLYIARMLVEAMGGRIWVESSSGQGSTFSIALPAAEATQG